MNKVRISRKHALGEEQCRVVAEDLLQQLVNKFGGSVQPQGSNYCYRHTTGLKAIVEPMEDELDIDIKLNLMTRSFAPLLEEQINSVLDEHIGSV